MRGGHSRASVVPVRPSGAELAASNKGATGKNFDLARLHVLNGGTPQRPPLAVKLVRNFPSASLFCSRAFAALGRSAPRHEPPRRAAFRTLRPRVHSCGYRPEGKTLQRRPLAAVQHHRGPPPARPAGPGRPGRCASGQASERSLDPSPRAGPTARRSGYAVARTTSPHRSDGFVPNRSRPRPHGHAGGWAIGACRWNFLRTTEAERPGTPGTNGCGARPPPGGGAGVDRGGARHRPSAYENRPAQLVSPAARRLRRSTSPRATTSSTSTPTPTILHGHAPHPPVWSPRAMQTNGRNFTGYFVGAVVRARRWMPGRCCSERGRSRRRGPRSAAVNTLGRSTHGASGSENLSLRVRPGDAALADPRFAERDPLRPRQVLGRRRGS